MLIASDVGGDCLALKLEEGSETALEDAVFEFSHDSGRTKRIASSLLLLFAHRPRPMTPERMANEFLKQAAAARRANKPASAKPKRAKPGDVARRISEALHGCVVDEVLQRLDGDGKDYVRLVLRHGALANEVAEKKLGLRMGRIEAIVASVLAVVERG